jgi:hypothetical protein
VNPTASVKAVDGCRTSTPPPQPGGILPTPPPAGSVPPVTTTPVTTTPVTTVPAAPITAPIVGGGNVGGGGRWQFIAPRSASDATIAAGATRTIRVSNLSGVPVGTTGVMLRLTASGAARNGHVITHPCDIAPPFAATLNVRAGTTAVGSAMTEVVGGTVCATVSTSMRLRVEVLAARGIDSAMIDASGDVLVSAAPPGRPGWRVAVAPLRAAAAGVAGPDLVLAAVAVTTSGDAHQAVEIDGRRYSHVVDPRTGLGVAGPAAVTVVARDCTTADAAATAASVLGPDAAVPFLAAVGECAARFVWEDGAVVRTAIVGPWPTQAPQSPR